MKKLLLLSVIISLGVSSAMAQFGDPLKVDPGLAKIGRMANPAEFLAESEFGIIPNLISNANIHQYPNANINIYIDTFLTSTQYILAFDAVKIGDYIKGKYVFNARVGGFNPTYMLNMYYGLGVVNAIRHNDVLYILRDEVVADVSALEGMVSEGRISKMDLGGDKRFIFSFVPSAPGSAYFYVKSEAPAEFEYVTLHNGVAVMTNISIGDVVFLERFTYEKVDGSLKEQSVVLQPAPIAQSRGGFSVSLAVSEENDFAVSFDVVLPEKFTLDKNATKLVSALAGKYSLTIIDKADNVWSFEIKPDGLRSGTTVAFREIVNVAYAVEKTLENGTYNIKVKDLSLTLDDDTVVEEDEIVIPIAFDSVTDSDFFADNEIYAYDGCLYINATRQMVINVYSMTGSLVKSLKVNAGESVTMPLSKGVYAVKAGEISKKILIK